MKRILITGVNSYVGNRFAAWLEQYPEDYKTTKKSLRNDIWKEEDFSLYDVVVHVAGIAHRKETKESIQLYYDVNRDLTNAVAKKAKTDGVKQFILLSSMSVYGLVTGTIDEDTPLNPKSHYGKSKLQGEELVNSLSNILFNVTILRPPMIYGKDCKGNYSRLASLAVKSPFFPDIKNQRSVVYIDHLNELIRLLIDDFSKGLFFPQNEEYMCTSDLVKLIAIENNKKIRITKIINPLFKIPRINAFKKVFGSLVYAKHLSKYKKSYQTTGFINTIKETEK